MTESRLQRSIEFAELVHQHHGDLFSFIFSLVLNQADTEDLYQETLVLLWQKYDQFRPESDFRSWAIRVAHLKVLNFMRGRRRCQNLFSDISIETIAKAHNRDGTLRTLSRMDALKFCIHKLTANDQRLISSRYSASKDIQEIAAAEGRSSEAIYKALGRIRQSLLACIERQLAMENR